MERVQPAKPSHRHTYCRQVRFHDDNDDDDYDDDDNDDDIDNRLSQCHTVTLTAAKSDSMMTTRMTISSNYSGLLRLHDADEDMLMTMISTEAMANVRTSG